MSFLGKKILNLRTRTGKNNRPTVESLNFENSKSIGLFYTWNEKNTMDTVEEFSKKLTEEGKEVEVLCFNPSKEEIDSIHQHFGIEQLSSLGKIKSETANQFMNKQFDYLMVLDFQFSEISSHIISNSSAIYRVGIHTEETLNLFDLMVNVKESAGIENLIEQILKYIRVIRHA